MRLTRRGFTLIEIMISTVIGAMLCGMIAMTIRLSIESKNQRNDMTEVTLDATETLDVIERLLQRCVEENAARGVPGGELKNFENPSPFSTAPDNDAGIHFFADVDPETDTTDLGPGSRKQLEWVWIWTDRNQYKADDAWPYEQRFPVKVAVFRAMPNGSFDNWTKPNSSLYRKVNSPNGPPKAYYTIGSDFAEFHIRVERFNDVPRPIDPVNAPYAPIPAPTPYPAPFLPAQKKRVVVYGGVFPDRALELPGWGQVAPGANTTYASGYPGGRSNIPSFPFCRTIYPRNLKSDRDPFLRNVWTVHPTRNQNRIIEHELSYNADTSNPGDNPKTAAMYIPR